MLNNISNTLKLYPKQTHKQHLYLYLLIAYIYGVVIRLILLYQVQDISSFWLDGTLLPIWTADAGRYGFYAKEILSGVAYPFDSIYIPGYLIAFITDFLGANIDRVMAFLPIFLAPLIVIPVILIGRSLYHTQFGFFSALVSVTAINYYMHTYIGYMDTDVLNLFFILLIIYFMIKILHSDNLLYAFGGSITIIVFSLWYHSSASINMALLGTYCVIVLLFYRQNSINYQAFLIFSIALIHYDPIIQISVIIIISLLFTLMNKYKTFSYHYYLYILLFASLLILALFDTSYYYSRALQYFSNNTLSTFEGNGITYHYTSFLQYVSEVKKVYLWDSQPGLYGMQIYILIATLGYILFAIGYPQMFVFLPLLILGYLSVIVGARFSLYASPVFAFGITYSIYLLQKAILYKYPKIELYHFIYFTFSILLIFSLNNILLFNNILKTNIYPLFKSDESKLLYTFSKNLSKNDKIIASWELGWPLWYYTGYNNTLTDNGFHGGPDTHAIAKIFMSPNQKFSANTSKYLSAKHSESQQHNSQFILPYIAKSKDLDILFKTLEHHLPNIKNKGNIYILVHSNMLNYLNLFDQFATKNFKTGKGNSLVEFAAFPLDETYNPDANTTTGMPFIFNHKTGIFQLPFKRISQEINQVNTIEDHKEKGKYLFHKNSSHYLLADEDKYLFYLNNAAYQTFLIQTFLLDNYNHKFFEKVGETKRMKIFKVR